MIIDFDKRTESVLPQFNGGIKEFRANIMQDENNKMLRGKLEPGASIGLHTHENTSEIIYILEGKGKVICDGEMERVEAGLCHYCPKGHAHSLINDSEEDLIFFAVIPVHE